MTLNAPGLEDFHAVNEVGLTFFGQLATVLLATVFFFRIVRWVFRMFGVKT